jgi:predicted GNAT superfamily acetyltransferase
MSQSVPGPHRGAAGTSFDVARLAAADADAAAMASGVRIRELARLADMQRACDLFRDIWAPGPQSPPMTTELLRALSHAGNYVAGAFLDDDMTGACMGFFGSPASQLMHSHIAGVSARAAGRHVGFALKLHQRAWALSHGVTTITWTFDPLVSRNAYFNITKLAAVATGYLRNFYGHMDDSINAGDDSDRLLVRWRLASDGVARACQGHPAGTRAAGLRAAGAAVVLDTGAAGQPVPGGADSALTPIVLVRVPPDVERMRVVDADLARSWRHAVRRALGGLIAAGGRVTGFDRSGWYVVDRGPAAAPVSESEEHLP